MTIEIKKAKIKNRLFLAYEYTATENGTENKISTSSDAPIHDDLQSVFNAFIPHFALITEEVKIDDKIRDSITGATEGNILPETLDKYSVTGITVAGSDDSEGVVISGYKELESGKVVNFNTPFQMFSDEDYEFTSELYECVENWKSEVMEYMNGKQAKRNQVGTFDFGDEEESESFKIPETDEEGYTDITGKFDLPEGMKVSVKTSKSKKSKKVEEDV